MGRDSTHDDGGVRIVLPGYAVFSLCETCDSVEHELRVCCVWSDCDDHWAGDSVVQ